MWISDGERIVFTSTREGGRGLFSRAADGTGEVEHLVTMEEATGLFLWGRPVDAGRLVISSRSRANASWDVAVLSLDGQPSLQPVLDSEANEVNPTVAPDGRWIAYASDESGDMEVYVQRFPDGGQRQRISTSGGVKPLWSPDGGTLYYVRQNAVMSVLVETEPTFTRDTPTVLFEADNSLEPNTQGLQDIHPDGQRFLALTPEGADGESAAQSHLILIQNWFQELTERVPVP